MKAVLAVTGSRLRGRSTSLTAAVSRAVVPLVVGHAVRPSRLRSSTTSRTARRARRASPCSRCRCCSRPAIRRQVHRGRRVPVQSRRESRQPARRPLPPARPRPRGRCLTASRGGPAALRIGLRRCGRWLAGGGRTAGPNSRQPPLADHAGGRQAAGRSLVAAVRRGDRLRSTVDLQAAASAWDEDRVRPARRSSRTCRGARPVRTLRDWRVDRAI